MLFYRIAKTSPPTLADFRSNTALGKQPLPGRNPQEAARIARLWPGVSVYDTEAEAMSQTRENPRLGSFTTVVEIIETGLVRFERTGSRGHHTLWGDAATLLEMVRHTRMVEYLET